MTSSPNLAPNQLREVIGRVVLGKDNAIRLSICGLLAGGHLLIEDLPGVGKTTLASALARSLGLRFTRLQFTSDLLPADLLGGNLYQRDQGQFVFHPGPIFTEVLLADEINRASPRTQSALLEAMEERQVSLDGVTHRLPEPFFVIATQNPLHQSGTFPLPESQLDRFIMCLSLGYPDPTAELALLLGQDRRSLLDSLPALGDARSVQHVRSQIATLHVSTALAAYVLALVQASRQHPEVREGLSPRAGLALLAAARAWAYTEQRDHVLPEDVQAVFSAVARHRLALRQGASDSRQGQAVAEALLQQVALP